MTPRVHSRHCYHDATKERSKSFFGALMPGRDRNPRQQTDRSPLGGRGGPPIYGWRVPAMPHG